MGTYFLTQPMDYFPTTSHKPTENFIEGQLVDILKTSGHKATWSMGKILTV